MKEVRFVSDQQPANVWAGAEERYQIGQEVRGMVTRVAQFGVFVQVEPELEGIIYAFELGVGPAALAGFVSGQEMQLYVKNIDANRKRLELSLNNDSTLGLLDEHMLPPDVRRKTPPGATPRPLLELPVRGTSVDIPTCPTCQRQTLANWKFCVYCGSSLQRHCPACGSTQPDLPDARYCYECGTVI
jgi:hypothetical protein